VAYYFWATLYNGSAADSW